MSPSIMRWYHTKSLNKIKVPISFFYGCIASKDDLSVCYCACMCARSTKHLSLWVKILDDILKYSSYFSQNTGFDISLKLRRFLCRQFAWNAKSCFLGKKKKKSSFVVCWISPESDKDMYRRKTMATSVTLSETEYQKNRKGCLWKQRTHRKTKIRDSVSLTLILLNPDMPCPCKQCRSRSVGF